MATLAAFPVLGGGTVLAAANRVDFRRGSLAAQRFAKEWAELHRAELERNWDLAMSRQSLATIDPLP